MTLDSPDREYTDLLKSVSFRPIFIIGDHRSGTTLLYQMLAATQCFHVLRAYHVIRYGEIITNHLRGSTERAKTALEQELVKLGLKNRALDGIEVTPDLPEEYGFIVEDSARPKLRPANLPKFIEMCRKLALVGGGDKPILLKNPWDCLSFTYLWQCFPEAKLIFLHRHPIATIHSQLRAVESMWQSRNNYIALLAPWYRRLFDSPWKLAITRLLASPRLGVWEHLVPYHVIRAARHFVQNVERLPAGSYYSLRYEDLCQAPRETMEKLLRFLGVVPQSSVAYEEWIAPRTMPLRQDILRSASHQLLALKPYLAYNGYNELP